MKNKKKVIWIIVVVIVAILAIFAFTKLKDMIVDYQAGMIARRNEAIFEDDETSVQIKNEIVFTGKVAPSYTQNIYYSAMNSIQSIKVEEGQTVTKDQSLITYYGADNIDDQITVQRAKFVAWQEDRDWYIYRIDELKQELSWADPANDGYVTSLKKEIARYQTLLATNRINWENAENEITRLKQSYDDYYVKASDNSDDYVVNDFMGNPRNH